MPGFWVDEMSVAGSSAEAASPLPFQSAGFKCGAVYAIGVETAAARLPLLLAPLQAALRAGRPCVLITRLDPEQAPFSDVLAHARQWLEAAHGSSTDLLQVFTAVGDYAVNQFLHGADRYLQELDQFQISPRSLLLIDEADDLYTPHDHGALVQQAKAYRAWCELHQHTMVQLHLRTSAYRPLLEGNQAAAQYLSGIARVVSQQDGFRMVVDFWETSAGLQTGVVIPLDLLSTSSTNVPGDVGVSLRRAALEGPPTVPATATLPPLWYIGQPDPGLSGWSRQFDVRFARSLSEVLPWRHAGNSTGSSFVVALDPSYDFPAFAQQMAHLRTTVGKHARIAVRESGYRLREHTQKRLLLRAGVDLVLPVSCALEELARLLLQPRREPVIEVLEGQGDAVEANTLETNVGDEAGWLGRTAFVEEAERRMQRSLSRQVPCALAEVDFEDSPALEAVGAAQGCRPPPGRTGDLNTTTAGAQVFFLQGCRGRDVVNVVTRRMDNALASRIQRIRLYTGESAMADRLLQLRQEASAFDSLLALPSPDKSATNVLAMPASLRGGQQRGQVGIALVAALVTSLALPLGDAFAQAGPLPAAASPAAAAVGAQAYEQGNYAQAARWGLMELQQDPRNAEVRLKVANSLAWTGQYPQAIRQYELLADTPLAAPARLGLANVYLWTGRAHLADPLFRQVLSAEPSNADAQRGLAGAQRQLRPRTTLRGGRLDDSSQTRRSTATLAHRWRDTGLSQIFEVSGEGVDESRSPAGPELQPRKVSFGYQNVGMQWAPKVQLTSDSGVHSSVYGNLALQLADGAATVELGRVNWGEIAFDPSARRDGLFARRVAVAGRVDAPVGGFTGSAAHFDVSDGNRVQEFSAQYTSLWQPFPAGSGLKAFVGVYGRKAARRDPRYWSPGRYFIGQFGLAVNRSAADWDLNAEVKRSGRLAGEGAQGWTVGVGGTRWLTPDWAVRLEGFHIETRRDNSAYRSKSIMVSLDRVW